MLLFAWDGYEDSDTKKENRKTFIERLHLETQQRTLLYTHTETMEVVAATINHECTLLGFTTITQYSTLSNGTIRCRTVCLCRQTHSPPITTPTACTCESVVWLHFWFSACLPST